MVLLNLKGFIKEQMQERYKHFIIYGPPLYGKTQLVKKIASDFGGLYVDLLKDFYDDHKKKENIDTFGPNKLIDYTRKIFSEETVVIVDQMDFLLNTWDDLQFREFLVFVDQNQSDACCIFIMHNYRIFERGEPIKVNDKGKSRLINMFNVKQGGRINA